MLASQSLQDRAAGVRLKDSILADLARRCNIAQFVSFAPNLEQRHACLSGVPLDYAFGSLEEACAVLLDSAESGAVNIRSFRPEDMKGQKFIQNLRSVKDVASAIRERANNGFFTIANEVIPLDDGGVSGVAIGDVIEFAPKDTPKCVEKPGVASLPRTEGERLLRIVYGFSPQIDFGSDCRTEFSLHPTRRGIRKEHTIIWELEALPGAKKAVVGIWPNRFSEFIGDKAYGLLIAGLVGCDVPKTTVISRNLPPFYFGKETGTAETWIRTCPRRPVPGKYTTAFGWQDPFRLLEVEDPDGTILSSVLAQESVSFVCSGAAQTSNQGVVIEGTFGRGDAFMVGREGAERLPDVVLRHVSIIHDRLAKHLGSVKFEWVWDNKAVWIVQLHRRNVMVSSRIIYPGHPKEYVQFDAALGLEALRELVSAINGTNTGIIIVGNVGVTSHFGDVLRDARVASKLSSTEEQRDQEVTA
jgi:hypothetical protein